MIRQIMEAVMSAKPLNEDAKKPAGEFLRGFLRPQKPADDGLHFILLEDALVPVALPRGRKLAPINPRKARSRWERWR